MAEIQLYSLHVDRLEQDITQAELFEYFNYKGDLYEAYLQKPSEISATGYTYGFVRFTHEEDAERTIRDKNNKAIRKNPVRVTYSNSYVKTIKLNPRTNRGFPFRQTDQDKHNQLVLLDTYRDLKHEGLDLPPFADILKDAEEKPCVLAPSSIVNDVGTTVDLEKLDRFCEICLCSRTKPLIITRMKSKSTGDTSLAENQDRFRPRNRDQKSTSYTREMYERDLQTGADSPRDGEGITSSKPIASTRNKPTKPAIPMGRAKVLYDASERSPGQSISE